MYGRFSGLVFNRLLRFRSVVSKSAALEMISRLCYNRLIAVTPYSCCFLSIVRVSKFYDTANLCNLACTRKPGSPLDHKYRSLLFHHQDCRICKYGKVSLSFVFICFVGYWLIPPPCLAFLSWNNSNCTQIGRFFVSSFIIYSPIILLFHLLFSEL